MRFGACPREREVSEMLGLGRWPEACGEELRTHVDGCRSCGELVLVRQAFGRERSAAAAQARLESPGVLWWRAQLRRRNAALERIGRPLLGAQLFAMAVSVAGVVAYALWLTRRGFDWVAWVAGMRRALHLDALVPGSWTDSPWALWFGISAAVMIALMGGVLAYLGSERR